MSRFIKKISKKAGLSPGTLIHTGKKKAENVRIRIIDYNDKKLNEKELKKVEESFPFKDKPTVTWLNTDGLHDTGVIEKLGKHFKVHPPVLEDILNTGQRPKMEDFDEYVSLF